MFLIVLYNLHKRCLRKLIVNGRSSVGKEVVGIPYSQDKIMIENQGRWRFL